MENLEKNTKLSSIFKQKIFPIVSAHFTIFQNGNIVKHVTIIYIFFLKDKSNCHLVPKRATANRLDRIAVRGR